MKNCIIIAGGEINDYSKIKINTSDSLVICADGGYNHAKMLGIEPDILIGDFDSLIDVPKKIKEIITLVPEKDDTDTLSAVRVGLKRGCNSFEIYGALGGRLDHTFANIQTLSFLKDKGIFSRINSDNEIITMIENEEIKIPRLKGYTLSIFAYSDQCLGVSESGVKYPLENSVINSSFPIGVSNEITDDFAKISVKRGKILIIQSKN